jgi:hypothetical protein
MHDRSALTKDRLVLMLGIVLIAGGAAGFFLGSSLSQRSAVLTELNTEKNSNAAGQVSVPEEPSAAPAVASKYTANIVEVTAGSLVVKPASLGGQDFTVTLTVDPKTILRAIVPLTSDEILEKAGQKDLYTNWDTAKKGPPPPLPAVDNPYKEEVFKLNDFQVGDLIEFETYLPPDKGTTVPAVSVTWLAKGQRSGVNGGLVFPETGGYPAPQVKK